MLSFQHVNIEILHTWSPLWKHVERAQKIFLSAVVGISHSWVLCRSWRAIWSPQASTASSSSQASSDLALHSYSPHVCACVVQIGWRQWWHSHSCGWLVFSKVTALPPHPWTDLREMLSGLGVRYSFAVIEGDALPRCSAAWDSRGHGLETLLLEEDKGSK